MAKGFTEKLVEIAENVHKVYEAGYAKGQAEGGNSEEAYNEGFEAGKVAEHDAFWDAYQDNGTREEYSHAFGGEGWNNRTFKPKYDIKPNSSYMMFRQFAFDGDLVDCLDNLGVTLDFSNSTNTVYMFALASKITHVGEIDARNTTSSTVFDMCFQNCSALKTIDKLKFKKGITGEFGTASFSNCTALENITMEGEIANNGLNLRYSPKLSRKSIESIVGCLSDDVSGKTITLSKTAVENAFGDGETTESENLIKYPYTDSEIQIDSYGYIRSNSDGTVDINTEDCWSTGMYNFTLCTITLPAGRYKMASTSDEDIGLYGDELSFDGVDTAIEESIVSTNGSNGSYEFTLTEEKEVTFTYLFNMRTQGCFYTVTPSLVRVGETNWETLKATKPNWTISLV